MVILDDMNPQQPRNSSADKSSIPSAGQVPGSGHELWLGRNQAALAAVHKGLAQAAAGQLDSGPDLDSSIAFAEDIDNE